MGLILRVVFIFFAITIGLYPLMYLLVDMGGGLLASKPADVLARGIWHFTFFTHISFGGIALLLGCPQFQKRLRKKRPGLHRALG